MTKVIELSGNEIRGGVIRDFASTGIKDSSTRNTITIVDNRVVVNGTIECTTVKTTTLIENQRYEKQFLEFTGGPLGPIGTGILWIAKGGNSQFLFLNDPKRFWLTENVDLPGDKAYHIDGVPVITRGSLGRGIVDSNLRSVGKLNGLNVVGAFNLDDQLIYNPVSKRIGIGIENANGLLSIYDDVNNIELILDGANNGHGKIGTFNTKGLDLVTDDQIRISITESGNVTIGQEYRDSTVTRIYGKVGIGVKNPSEQLEVSGNIRVGNRLHANADSLPTSGSYQRGDIIWNTNPRDYVGWICTIGGNPGTWKPWGRIEN